MLVIGGLIAACIALPLIGECVTAPLNTGLIVTFIVVDFAVVGTMWTKGES